jgi:hypothetical protein
VKHCPVRSASISEDLRVLDPWRVEWLSRTGDVGTAWGHNGLRRWLRNGSRGKQVQQHDVAFQNVTDGALRPSQQ